jgi:catechol 2,3-dioxygenase-like lactoylglutathione lyase family enzyme
VRCEDKIIDYLLDDWIIGIHIILIYYYYLKGWTMLGLEHPGIYVSNLEKSIEFYQKLGFKILRKTTRPHAMMYLGTDIIEIIPDLDKMKKDGFSPPIPFHLGFYTDDIEEVVASLREQGIEVGEIASYSDSALKAALDDIVEYADPVPDDSKLFGCMKPSDKWKRVAFKDPDGVSIEIWQRL